MEERLGHRINVQRAGVQQLLRENWMTEGNKEITEESHQVMCL